MSEARGGSGVAWPLKFLAVGLLVALDLWSKAAVFEWFAGDPDSLVRDRHGHLRLPLVGDWLALMESTNKGAAWGILADYPRALIGGRVVAVLVLAYLVLRPAQTRALGVALVLVLAGALGNLYDNLFLEPPVGHPFGAVRDFIDVDFAVLGFDWHFPTFNVADSCITVGAVLLIASGLFGSSTDDEASEDEDEAEDAAAA